MRSRASRSGDSSPRTVPTIVGKNVIIATIAILLPCSTPNQTIASGAKAMMGTELAAIAYGRRASATDRHRTLTTATPMPSVHPIANPASASWAVYHAAPIRKAAFSARLRAISEGAGSR